MHTSRHPAPVPGRDRRNLVAGAPVYGVRGELPYDHLPGRGGKLEPGVFGIYV